MRTAAERLRVGQLRKLFGRRVDQPLLGEAERRRPQPGHALDVAFAIVVEDVNAFTAIDDERPSVADRLEVGVGMDEMIDVELAQIDGLVYGSDPLIVLAEVFIRPSAINAFGGASPTDI